MSQQRDPRDQVIHAVRGYHRGHTGPSLMWLSIANALTPTTATAVLDSLPQDVKEQLRAVWLDRPPHAYIARSPSEPGDEDLQAVCVQVVRWCEANGPLDRPSQPDGLVRVWVQDGVVREWHPWEDSSSYRTSG
jgi:hypothetical protein